MLWFAEKAAVVVRRRRRNSREEGAVQKASSSSSSSTEGHEMENPVVWMAISDDFGKNFTYQKMPAEVQAYDLIVDPTR